MGGYLENQRRLSKDLEEGRIETYCANLNDNTFTVISEDGVETVHNDDEWRPAP